MALEKNEKQTPSRCHLRWMHFNLKKKSQIVSKQTPFWEFFLVFRMLKPVLGIPSLPSSGLVKPCQNLRIPCIYTRDAEILPWLSFTNQITQQLFLEE